MIAIRSKHLSLRNNDNMTSLSNTLLTIIKTFAISVLLMIAGTSFSGCNSDPCETVVCQNGGTCDDGSCVCPQGFSGSSCENNNNPACVQNNTGTVVFSCWSNNPYDCYVNGSYVGRVGGNSTLSVNRTAGFVSVKTIQVSGYVFTPSEFTGSGNLQQCGTLTFNFP